MIWPKKLRNNDIWWLLLRLLLLTISPSSSYSYSSYYYYYFQLKTAQKHRIHFLFWSIFYFKYFSSWNKFFNIFLTAFILKPTPLSSLPHRFNICIKPCVCKIYNQVAEPRRRKSYFSLALTSRHSFRLNRWTFQILEATSLTNSSNN